MTNEQPIDLIRRMPNLYYAAELAARAPHDQMPVGYAEAVLARARRAVRRPHTVHPRQ